MDVEQSSALLKCVLSSGGWGALRPSLGHIGILTILVAAACHKGVTYLVLYPLFRLLFGTLYPAYASYKAVRTKNVKEYVKWMMYWIVFALFTCIETFTDVFLSWFPFYYEIKIILVIWLLSPATKGSSFLYRKFVHPMLSSREQEIDDYISKAKEQSYKQVLDLGSKGMTALMQTALKGGGGIVNQLRKSYSLGDLSDPSLNEDQDERDVVITDPRLRRRRISPHRSSSTSSATIYFSEVDIRADRLAHIQSAEDISSGYSSAEGLYASGQPKLQARESLSRTGSLTRSRTVRSTRSSTVPKKTSSVPSDESDENEVFDTNIIFLNDKVRAIDRLAEEKTESSSEGEFLDTLDNLHGNKELNGNVSVLTACLDSKTDRSLIPNPKFSERMIKLREQVEDAYVKIKEAVVSNDKIVSLTPTEVNHDSKLVEHNRGGRYNKKMAPVPPIKATLVLKPGVVKNIGTSESCKEIFMHSPKAKRRSLSNASSSSKSKLNPLTKLMKLPKKMGFWKEGLSLSDSKKQSKSANDLPTVSSNSGSQLSLNNPNKSPRGSQLSLIKSGSQLSVKSLTESPLAHRRLKVVRKLIDEDLD